LPTLQGRGTFDQQTNTKPLKHKAMKTLSILSTVLLAAISLNASAEINSDGKARKAKRSYSKLISYPEMRWGNPADVYATDVKALRNTHYLFEAPEMIWGSAEEVSTMSIERLKNVPMIATPEMVWGSAEDIDLASVEALKSAPLVPFLEMVWGNPADVSVLSEDLSTQEN
jgi:hypothetical protein